MQRLLIHIVIIVSLVTQVVLLVILNVHMILKRLFYGRGAKNVAAFLQKGYEFPANPPKITYTCNIDEEANYNISMNNNFLPPKGEVAKTQTLPTAIISDVDFPKADKNVEIGIDYSYLHQCQQLIYYVC